jgi:toxin ParE1/3/4
MAYRLVWAPSATLDLKEIASYIAESRPEASIKFVESVFHSVEHLIDFPESGRIVPEFGDPSIREVVRKPCRIVYRIKSKKRIIEVVRVWHAARGIPQI